MTLSVTGTNSLTLTIHNKLENIVSSQTVEAVDNTVNCGFTSFFFIIGGSANLLTVVVFYRQGLRDRMNLCLFCLAFVDLMYLTTNFINAAYCFIGVVSPDQKYFWKSTLLKYCLSFVYSSKHLSGCVTMIIAVERCVCVMFPMKVSTLISTKTMAIILLVTFIVIQLLCGVYFIKETITVGKDPDTGKTIVTLTITELYRNHPVFSIIENIVLSFISFLNFIVVFLTTVITVIKLRDALAWRKSTASSSLKSEVVLMRMLVAVSCSYILCTAPVIALALVRFAVPEFRADGYYGNLFIATHVTFLLPFMLNASMHFFVYIKMSSRFRHELQTLCVGMKMVKTSKPVLVSNRSHVK